MSILALTFAFTNGCCCSAYEEQETYYIFRVETSENHWVLLPLYSRLGCLNRSTAFTSSSRNLVILTFLALFSNVQQKQQVVSCRRRKISWIFRLWLGYCTSQQLQCSQQMRQFIVWCCGVTREKLIPTMGFEGKSRRNADWEEVEALERWQALW